MEYSMKKIREGEQGFTLVELAVVMIIIGLLIGGILKGQELITNARITSTIAQMESLSAAKNDFQNQFSALPGDMGNASVRIGTCGAIACVNGDGNGALSLATGAALATGGGAAGENGNFFQHLLGAGYLTGYTGVATVSFGQAIPGAPIGGGYSVGAHPGAATGGFPAARAGMYLQLQGTTAAVAAGNGILTPSQAERIDTKLDDGLPQSGTLIGDTVNGCTNAGPPVVYNGAATTLCSVAYRI